MLPLKKWFNYVFAGLIMCVCNENHLNKAMCSHPEFPAAISRVTIRESLIVPETHSMKQITDK